jgi:hypothetical protein
MCGIMNRTLFLAVLFLYLICINSAYAENTASQTITATLSSFVTVSNIENSSTSVQINEDGRLSADLNPTFKFLTNSKNGASATFNVKVNTSDAGQVDAISGSNNTSSGIIVLANSNAKPDLAAVVNALSNDPTDNPDVIAYQVFFKIGDNDKGNAPVFDKTGNTANGNVLNKTGENTVTVIVDKNSARTGSFSNTDKPGSYQATIYCTSANL